jgi:hypothetical protein
VRACDLSLFWHFAFPRSGWAFTFLVVHEEAISCVLVTLHLQIQWCSNNVCLPTQKNANYVKKIMLTEQLSYCKELWSFRGLELQLAAVLHDGRGIYLVRRFL